MNHMIVTNLNKSYPNFQLKKASFEVPKGYITGFIGKNGSGKTTTLKTMLSLIQKDSGDIVYEGKPLHGKDLSYLQEVGLVMDNAYILKDWTMRDIDKAMTIGYKNWNSKLFFDYLQQFNISASLKVKELSRGMTTKLMLAISFSHNAKILILDEPTSGLDPAARDEICDLLQAFVEDEDRTVLFSTHILQDLEAIADYIIYIHDGEIVYSGTKEDLLANYLVIKGSLEELERIPPKLLLGVKKHSFGFEGMIESKYHAELPQNLVAEPMTLENIIIFYHRGGIYHDEY